MSASYNNSFGQSDVGASNMGMVSSGDASGVGPVISGDSGGDIIISSSDGSRGGKRRWPIVVAILLFVVAIGAGVGALMMGKPSGGGGGDANVRSAFNLYANYLLYGEDTDEDIGENMGLYYLYYFDSQDIELTVDDEEEEQVVIYYSELKKRLADFTELVKNNEENDNDSLVIDYSAISADYFTVRQTYLLNSGDIRMLFEKNGYDQTVEYINEYYSGFIDSDSTLQNALGGFLIDYSNYYLAEYNAYKDAGCAMDAIDSDECRNMVNIERDTNIISIDDSIESIIENMRREVIKGCWEVYEKIS